MKSDRRDSKGEIKAHSGVGRHAVYINWFGVHVHSGIVGLVFQDLSMLCITHYDDIIYQNRNSKF